jgi:hypothetical protein
MNEYITILKRRKRISIVTQEKKEQKDLQDFGIIHNLIDCQQID